MDTLFLFGNGFDLAHEMKTTYYDFREFLKEKNPGLVDILDAHAMWSEFEESLGYLDFSEERCIYFDEEDNSEEPKAIRNIISDSQQILELIRSLNENIIAWIDTVCIASNGKSAFTQLFSQNVSSSFLSFNYTKTLERLYYIEDVCHIHIIREEEFLLGHGEPEKKTEEIGNRYSNIMATYYEIQEVEELDNSIHNTLKKDTNQALKEHKNFFSRLSNIKKVYSYGFSYGNVDLIYIEEILRMMHDSSNVVWYLDDYNQEKNKEYEEKIRKCGFLGAFDRFNVS